MDKKMDKIRNRVVRLEEAISELPEVKDRLQVLEKGVEKVIMNVMPTLEAVLSSSDNAGLRANCVLSTNLQAGGANPQPSSVSPGNAGPGSTDDAALHSAAAPSDGAPAAPASVLAAVERGDAEALAQMLAAGADTQQRDRNGDTALHLAATRGHLAATVVLLAFGASVNAPGRRLRSPLHCAAAHGRLHVAQRLLAAGADVMAEDADGATPLTRAREGDHDEMLELLLKNVARLDSLTEGTERLVCWAAARGHVDFVQLALKAGLSVDVHDGEGEPLALRSAKAGQWGVVMAFVRKGFYGAACKDPRCDALEGCFESVLALASEAGEESVVREVMTFGSAEKSVWRRERHAVCALRVARNAQVVGAFGDVVKGRVGAEALFHASREGSLTRLNNLIAGGVESTQHFAGEALIAACDNGHMTCVMTLLDYGVSVNFVSFPGTPLVAASKTGQVEVVRELLRRGARDKDHRALLFARNGAVVWALAEGARDALRGEAGGKALACAVEEDRLEAMVALLDAGVDVKLAGAALNKATLQSAASRGNKCAKELLKREIFADD